jgi:putative membrane protein
MKDIALIAACLLAAAPALAQSTADKAKDLGEKAGVNSVVGAAPTTAEFVNQAAISDMFEIKESQLAAQRGDAQTKQFAQHMVQDHTKTSDELKGMLQKGTVKAVVPPDLDKKHQKMVDDLSAEKPDKFDKAYRKDQVSAHETAVSLFDRYSKNGDDPALKAWATKTLPALQHHLQLAKDLEKQS